MTPSDDTRLNLLIRLRLIVAWAAVAWERLWARLWLAASIVGFIVAVVLMDVLPALPGWLHLVLLAGAFGGLGYICFQALRDFRWPTWDTAKTRLEQSGQTPHRPLTTVQDTLAGESNDTLTPAQKLLWQLHQSRARENLHALRTTWPAPNVAARDRFTLRAGAIVVLFIAVVGSWDDMSARFMRAAWPSWDATTSGPNVKVWITPPTYTGRSPIFVESPAAPGATQPALLDVPEKSKVLAVVTGTPRETTFSVDENSFVLEKLADKSQRIEREMPSGDVLDVKQRGRTLGSWRMTTIPDMPPSINFVREPREAGRWRLRLDYRASDDYGIGSVTARIVRPEIKNPDPNAPEESIEFDVTVPPFNPREALQASLHDLTAHPWAGQPVLVQLIVTDQANQSAVTNYQDAILPERVFQHPVAKDLIAIRRGLLNAADPQALIVPAFRKISGYLQNPQSFGGDVKVYLELATAKYRLAYHEDATTDGSLAPILWAAAVRIEDGNLAVAEERMDEAEQALKDAMERGAPPEEIARLIDELQRAIGDYARELASRMPEGEESLLNPEQGMTSVGAQDLMKMMQEMRQMNQMGAKDAAKEMMADLQNMLQALRSMSTKGNDNPDVKQAQEIMRDLKNLTAEQSKLLEETFQQARESQLQQQRGGEQSREQNQAQGQQQQRTAAQQDKLRQQLGELMGRMAEAAGQVPPSMSGAEGNMREAREAIESGALKSATDAQAAALAQLQDSMGEANQQLMQALQEKGLSGTVAMPGEGQNGNDPLGQRNGPDAENQVEIPDAPDINSMAERVRIILEEIRGRASDRTRPSDEQDYLRRLMKQF